MITILASIKIYPKINPLLWNLVTYKPNQDFELILINNSKDHKIDLIKEQLNNFRSAYKWSFYQPGEQFELLDLVQENILSMPANCIPYKDAINKLISVENSYANCKFTGALLAFSSNDYCSNINQMMLDDCQQTNIGIWYGKKGFILNNHAGIYKFNQHPIFIGSDIIYNGINHNMKLELVEKNY